LSHYFGSLLFFYPDTIKGTPLQTMPGGRSFSYRRPGRYSKEKQEFQRLITELKRLALKEGYSQEQIASEVGVSPVTVSYWWMGHSSMAQRKSVERLKTFLATDA
jgi:DNA-binding XRE family transcriptional regulator